MPLNYYKCSSFILRPPHQLFLILIRCMLLVRNRCSGWYSSQNLPTFPLYVPPSLSAAPASIPLKTYQLFPQYVPPSLPAGPASIPIKTYQLFPLYVPPSLPAAPAGIPIKTYQLFPQYVPPSLPAVPASMPRNSGWLISP